MTRKSDRVTSKFIIGVLALVFSIGMGFYLYEHSERSYSREELEQIKYYTHVFSTNPENLRTRDLDWMIQSEDHGMVIRAATLLAERGNLTQSIEVLEQYKTQLTATDLKEVAYDTLSQIYIQRNDDNNAARVLEEALDVISTNTYASRWFGYWFQVLSKNNDGRHEELQRATDKCFARFQNTVAPHHCYHQAGKLEKAKGNYQSSSKYFFELFRFLLQSWKDEFGNPCPATFVPLAIDSQDTNIYREKIILDSNIQNNNFLDGNTSEQEWPYVISVSEGNFKVDSWKTKYSKMGCFTSKGKQAVLYKIPEASVLGAYFFITQKISQGSCINYTPGFPYVNSYSHPRFEGHTSTPYLSLPIKKMNNVLILHAIDINFYHFTAECLPKVMIALHHPQLRDIPNLKILVKLKDFSRNFFEILGISHMVVSYEPDKFRYHIRNLFVVDWFIDSSAEETKELQTLNGIHFEEYYLPPSNILKYARSILLENEKISKKQQEARDLVVFVHRPFAPRNIIDSQPLYNALSDVSKKYGFEFQLHGSEQVLSFEEQFAVFSRAVVLMGVHGAGLTNMIFCKEGTTIIELPTSPEKLSEFSRMASCLNFPYYITPGLSVDHFNALANLTTKMIIEAELTLEYALQSYLQNQPDIC